MASEGTNHLVTLFLISNCFCGFGFGVFLFAVGVANPVIAGAAAVGYQYIGCIVVGLIITFWSMVGCFAAIAQNKKKLSGYVAGMTSLSILEIIQLVKLDQGEQHTRNEVEELTGICAFMILIVVLQLVTILLGITISCRIVSGEIDGKERQQQRLGAA